MNPNYPAVAARAANRCEYCRAPEAAFNFPFEVEHILPSAAGGPTDESNLALGCRSCNLYKSISTTGRDPDTGELVALFNPREDRWDVHFAVQADGSIFGLTATGRVTVERLKINSARQVAARRLWKALRIFP